MISSIERPISGSIRRNIIQDPYADTAEDNGALRLDTWHLVKGGTRTYNVTEKLSETRTGWRLDEPPNGFTINNVGVIRANLPHLYTTPPGELRVMTDQGNIRVPTTIRDWFPADYRRYTPTAFFSTARAHSGAADQTLLSIEIWNPNTGETLRIQTDIRSAADGYLDRKAIRRTATDITDGVIVVPRLHEQITGGWANYDVDNAEIGALGYIANGNLTLFESPANRAAIRGNWKARDFNSAWSEDVKSQFFDYAIETPSLADNYFFFAVLQNHVFFENRLGIGDANSYPGLKFRDNPISRYFLGNNDDDPSVTVVGNHQTDWMLWEAHSLLANETQYRKHVRYFDLERIYETGDVSNDFSNLGDGHYGPQLRIFAKDFSFSEFALYHVDNLAQANTYRSSDFDNVYATNATAVYGGQDIQH